MGARVMQVIVSDDCVKGAGQEDDPIRVFRRYYTLDGDLLFEIDTWAHGDQYYDPGTYKDSGRQRTICR